MIKPVVLAFALVFLPASVAIAAMPPQTRDGVHDFDFARGRFRTHIQRLEHPLSGSTTWLVYDGIKADRPILGGAGGVELIEADGAGHLELMTLRLYDADAGQWSLNFSTSSSGQLGPPAIGEFTDGVGTFLSQEEYGGRIMLVRQTWSRITPTSYHFEQAFSADHGANWELNFVADLIRADETD
jgi:hypothetical protein